MIAAAYILVSLAAVELIMWQIKRELTDAKGQPTSRPAPKRAEGS